MQPAAPQADAAGWEREIRALEDEARLAFLAADLNTLGRLWVDDYLVNSPLQRVNGKAQLLELVRTGRVRHLTHEAEIEEMRRHGDVVIVMGNDTVTDPPDGVRSRRRYTNIWQLQDGVWRSIARHAHVVSREPPA